MKRHFTIALLSLVLPALAPASPVSVPSAIYVNPGVVTTATNIDAITFLNLGLFDIDGVLTATNLALGSSIAVSTAYPFNTRDTVNYTNLGTMIGTPGYQFDRSTPTSRFSSQGFYNYGTILGLDFPAFPEILINDAGTAAITLPAYSQPLPSIVKVFATNIVNQGSINVGDVGLVQLTGQNVDLGNSLVAAGYASENAANNTTGNVDDYGEEATTTQEFYVAPPEVYDLFWGVTNAVNEELRDFIEGEQNGSWFLDLPFPPVNFRGGFGLFGEVGDFGVFNEFTNLTAYTYESFGLTSTDIYYTVVFLNTNFGDTNITANVRFSQGDFGENTILGLNSVDPFGVGAIVQFTEPVYDVSTAGVVSNSIYLLDSGSEVTNNYSVAVNAASTSGYGRPDRLRLSTSVPFEWEEGFLPNTGFDPGVLYTPQEFQTDPVPMNFGAYGVQVGRDPEQLTGLDPWTSSSFFTGNDDFPDPTNEAGRVEINAQTLNLANTRLQAEGVVTLNATNLMGIPFGTDWGSANTALGSRTNAQLIVSNLFPTTFHRLRGDLEVWVGNWVNIQTNDGFGNTNFNVTNSIHYHVLWVNQDLRGAFHSSERNLSLRGTNVVIEDSLRVVNNALIAATNLTFNNTNIFTQNAGSVTGANLPGLQNLLINTNAGLLVDDELDIGYDLNKGTTSAAGRKYVVSSVTNLGTVTASVALFDSATFENDGAIDVSSQGTITIEANSLGMGLVLTNPPNSIQAGGSVTLSANSIQATNSVIRAGLAGFGQLVLETDAAGLLTDLVSGAPSTNQHLVNHWQATGGFSLLQKPAAGDLFGTEITTVATGFHVASHVWAGTDFGNNASGFSNNAVIGHLKLSRQSANAELHFSGAGAKNAMYVDYLDLDPASLSYSDYRDGMVVDPNLTIYFADSNVDPFKLEDAYPNRLVWVPGFSGPNSSLAVPYRDSSNYCLMNAALATSQDISFFPGSPPNFFNQPFVLNDPNNATNIYPCPGATGTNTNTTLLLISRAANGGAPVVSMISVVGDGHISPTLREVDLGKTYTLTATPAMGWVFSDWLVSGVLGETIKGNVLKFTAGTNTAIQAVFVLNPFVAAQGTYNGLFYDTNAVNPGSSGFLTLTLRSSGAYSGHALMGPKTYTFSSNFNSLGVSQVVAKDGKSSLTLSLQLVATNGAEAISGTVTQAGWADASQLWADLGLTWKGKNHSPWAGTYTASLPWNTHSPSAGDSYATALVYDSGLLSAMGGLADGTTFSQTVSISKDGLWPFYAYTGSAKDLILGWVTVSSNGLASTNVTWSKGVNNGVYYKEGFTNILQMVGSPYLEQDPPLAVTNPVVVLSGADLAQNLTNSVALKNSLTYTSSIVTLNIQPVSGSLSGWWLNTNTGKREAISGVVLQNTNSARGFFLDGSVNGSGSVLLQSQ